MKTFVSFSRKGELSINNVDKEVDEGITFGKVNSGYIAISVYKKGKHYSVNMNAKYLDRVIKHLAFELAKHKKTESLKLFKT